MLKKRIFKKDGKIIEIEDDLICPVEKIEKD